MSEELFNANLILHNIVSFQVKSRSQNLFSSDYVIIIVIYTV